METESNKSAFIDVSHKLMTDRQKLMSRAYTTLGMTVPFPRDAGLPPHLATRP